MSDVLTDTWDAEFDNIVATAERRLGDTVVADDIAIRALTRLANRLAAGKPTPDPGGFVRVVAHGMIVDEIRRRVVREKTMTHLIDCYRIKVEAGVRVKDQPFVVAALDAGIRELDPDDRAAWLLVELRGLPLRETAAMLDVSHPTVIRRTEAANTYLQEAV